MQHLNQVSLAGKWRFRKDPERLGEHYSQQLDIPWQYDARWMSRTHDDASWDEIAVPACWQAEGHAYDGVAWHRMKFASPLADGAPTRAWLCFDGILYFADVWLNERYLGSHEGFFDAFGYEVTPYLAADDNLLCVRVDAGSDIRAKESQVGQLKTLLKGALQRWDMNNPEVNPGGIWNDVRLVLTGPAAITGLQVQTVVDQLPPPDDTARRVPATIICGVRLAGAGPAGVAVERRKVRLRVQVAPVGFEGVGAEVVVPVRLAAGESEWTAALDLPAARLWYTWDTGEPCLYELCVTVEVDGQVSDHVLQNFGIRTIAQGDGWATYLNGIRIFQRGANYLSDQLLSTMTRERYATDVRLLREANLNTVHPFCVVERQEFYDLCDSYGILVYQDFPMWLMMSNDSNLVRRAVQQLEALIAQYGHHPAIAIWNFGSQASPANFEKLCSALSQRARELDPGRIVQQSNALVDPGTPHAQPPDPVGTFHWTEATATEFRERFDWRADTHQYDGWYSQDVTALAVLPAELLELVTEFGAQALPCRETLEQFIPADALFPPRWPVYTRRCFQPEYQFRYLEPPASLDEFVAASQAYQAQFLQYHVEHYRRHKFDPCNGAHMFCFNDCWPAITWSVVDYYRRPKPGFYALQRAMAPVQAFMEPAQELIPGLPATAKLWVVSDRPSPLGVVRLDWAVTEAAVSRELATGSFAADVAANSLAPFGALAWTPPSPGVYRIGLRLISEGRVLAENEYRVSIAHPAPEG